MTPKHTGVYMISDYEGGEQRCIVEWDRGYGAYRVRVDGEADQWRGTNSIGRFLSGHKARKLVS